MKIKNKILIGLLSVLSCVGLANVNSFAWYSTPDNNYIVSENILNLNNYTYKDDSVKLLDVNGQQIVSGTAFQIEFPCEQNTNIGQFVCEVVSNNQVVYTSVFSSTLDGQVVPLLLGLDGYNVPSLISRYPDSYIRFKRNGNVNDLKVEYSFIDMLNYAQTYYQPSIEQPNGLVLSFVVNSFNDGTQTSTIVEELSIHFAHYNENLNSAWYETPGIFYNKYAPQSVINDESYLKGRESNQIENDNLKNQVNSLTKQNQTLQQQLENSIGWKALAFAMADTPFKTLSNMLGFEVFGLNLWKLLVALITLLIIVYFLRKLLGR